jgi:hypothetical protein
MRRERTIQIVLVSVVVILLLLNIVQFMLYSEKSTGVSEEDVPMQISELKGENWESKIGETVTVGGYYIENNGIPMLITDPDLLTIRRPMDPTEYVLIDAPFSNATMLGQYHLKGEVERSTDVNEKIFLKKELATLIMKPVIDQIPQYYVHYNITVPPEHSSIKYAVLISGAFTLQDSWPSFWNDLKLVYSVLVNQYNYDPYNIYVLFSNGDAPDDDIPVDYSATPSNIDIVLEHLASVMDPQDQLLFYATDHGGSYEAYGFEPDSDAASTDEFIALWNKTGYTDDRLNNMLYHITFSKAIIILDMCDSGGFTWDLSRDNRIIMTASREDEGARDHPDYPNGDFTYNLFRAFQNIPITHADKDSNGLVSVAEAFNYASLVSILEQTPTYDDNGDGVSHYFDIPNGGVVEDEGRNGLTYL